ncbi:MAG: hypothetical protein J2P40_13135 [Candidatus Dormibacteraeota bacterium]|nr:hypothetical protein [Candidatus Dormibacteraeota bacterium]MBO0762212.1 hypothetical protein [Candidatus Dormibacteraeota bacterium]
MFAVANAAEEAVPELLHDAATYNCPPGATVDGSSTTLTEPADGDAVAVGVCVAAPAAGVGVLGAVAGGVAVP